jgi:catechol 2,3-dioxygenase-like lactoylglutathione lyase family enzyme
MHRVHHVGLTVSDLDAATGFYTELLGSTVVEHIEPDDHAAVRTLVGVPDAEISGRLIELPSGDRVELLAYRSGYRRRVDVRPCDPGAMHLACAVPDLAAATGFVRRRGGTVVGDPVRFGRALFVYCTDPDGNVLELIEENAS